MKSKLLILTAILTISISASADDPYTIRVTEGPSPSWQLCRINLQTGALEGIGSGATSPSGPLSLVYHPDGFIYAAFENPLSLVRIDPSNGVSVVVGPLAVDLQMYTRPDLSVGASGDIWMLDDRTLYKIDTETGVATLQCSQQNPDTHLQGLDLGGARQRTIQAAPASPLILDCGLLNAGSRENVNLEWLATDSSGQLYAMGYSTVAWPGWGYPIVYLFRFDYGTGSWGESVADFQDQLLYGLTYSPSTHQPGGVPVPTLGLWGFVAICSLLAFAGVLFLLTRQA